MREMLTRRNSGFNLIGICASLCLGGRNSDGTCINVGLGLGVGGISL